MDVNANILRRFTRLFTDHDESTNKKRLLEGTNLFEIPRRRNSFFYVFHELEGETYAHLVEKTRFFEEKTF